MTQTPSAPAGWYPQGAVERWWDGTQWSDHTRPLQAQVTASAYPPAQPYQPPPQQRGHTVRNLLIAFGVLFVLLVGGCVAGVAIIGHKVDDAVNDQTPGGPRVPLTITPGRAFSVKGFDYAAGWSVRPNAAGAATIENLKVTNNRGKTDQAGVEIKLLKGGEVLASVACESGSRIAAGATVTLICTSSDPMNASWDRVTIQDFY